MDKQRRVTQNLGFTLIEVILVMAIMAIVITGAFSIHSFGQKTYMATSDKAMKQFDVRMPTDFIAKSLRFSDSVIISSTPPMAPADLSSNQLFIDATGKLVYKEAGSIARIIGASDTAKYTFSVAKKSGTSNVLELTVGMAGTTAYDLITDVEILNLSSIGITGDISGTYIEYKTTMADGVEPMSINSIVAIPIAGFFSGGDITMPLRVTAMMSDGSTRQVPVIWTTPGDWGKTGINIAQGKVVGYAGNVEYRVNVGPLDIAEVTPIELTTYRYNSFVMPDRATVKTISGEILDIYIESWDPVSIDTNTTEDKFATGYFYGFTETVSLVVHITDVSISSIESSTTVTVSQGVSFSLPTHLAAKMSDGTIQNVPVTWNPTILNTMSTGLKTSTTYVPGYGTVTFSLTVIPSALPKPLCTVVSTGNNGSIKVYGQVGATVALRKSNEQVIATSIIESSGEVLITGVNTNNLHDAILTMPGRLDSEPFIFNW